MCYSDVSLFETQEEAKKLAQAYDLKDGRCHASIKDRCRGNHPVIDLQDFIPGREPKSKCMIRMKMCPN
jgi:hypothetical protein